MRWLVVSVFLATACTACGSGQHGGADGTVAVVSVAATRDGSVAATEPITVAYGADPSQFGQLWLPIVPKSSLLPVVVLIHGGFWREEYGLDLMDPLAKDLISRGDAVWNIEYRRVGQDGGGYPGTLDDVAAAIDALQGLAPTHHLDLADVVLVGHSAGGQLSLWAAGRATLPAGAPGADPKVTPRLAIGQGPVVDLVAGDAQGLGGGAVTDFIGGTAAQFPDRYAIASPNTSSGVPLAVVRGSADDIVPAAFTLPPDQAQAAQIAVVDIPGADHFALIDPASTAWQAVITLLD